MSRILCLMLFIIFNHLLYGQPFNSARLVTIIGSHITFNFNTIDKHSTGLTKNNHTRLGVHFVDSTAGVSVTGWKITAIPSNGATAFEGSGGSNTMALDVLEIKATNALGLGGATYNGWIALDPVALPLVESTTMPAFSTTHQVDISYRCGVPPKSVFGVNSDFYDVEIDFLLSPVP